MSEKIKDTKGKPPLGHVLQCGSALSIASEVMKYGDSKYYPGSWRKVAKNDFFDAAIRHLTLIKQGEIIDKESQLPHIGHAICNLLYIGEIEWGIQRKNTPDWREETSK